METFFCGMIGILILVGICKAIYDCFREPSEKMNDSYVSPFKEETRIAENGDRITRFQCPNPATADFGLIQEFLDHEFFMPKIEHYLRLAKEMNAPAAVIEAIEEKIRFDRELSQRIIDQEMEELDAELERSSRNAESEYKIKRMLESES